MEARTPAQIIEVFHLLFLRVLAAGRPDWFVLKGGANIRYFFDSPRYSNDIDLDVVGRQAWQVGESVEKILSGSALRILTQQAKVDVLEVSAPKQTNTTRRWKIALGAADCTSLMRTMIKFSDRGGVSEDFSLDSVPESVVVPYGLSAPMVQHYGENAAIEQKIAALALRSETKARDVFDLDLLLKRHNASVTRQSTLSREYATQASSRALEITFNSFTTEVAPFLDSGIAALYDESEWDRIVEAVASGLERIATPRESNRDR